jgi:hypothetical protein
LFFGLGVAFVDYQFVFVVCLRFWHVRIGILAQIGRASWNRSSPGLHASFSLPGADLKAVYELFFTGLGL